MDNISINILAPGTQEIKADKIKAKSSERTTREGGNNFDTQLERIKSKEIKLSKSIIKADAKDIVINKPIELNKLDEKASQEAVCQMILSLINNVLEIPVEDIEKILEKMNVTPLELLNPETFKEFLTYVYPNHDEHQLLFDEGNLKDISKLFAKFEQISEVIEGDQGHLLIEKIVTQEQVVKTTITQIDVTLQAPEKVVVSPENEQLLIQSAAPKDLAAGVTLKDMTIDEAIPEGNFSEEGLLNFQKMGLGASIPIQAFNATVNTTLWDMQNTQLESSHHAQSQSLTHQMINKLDITSLGNSKEITMELSPKELGHLSIKLVESNGVLVANIRVDNEKTKDLLLNEVAQLKQTLESQGLSVGEVKVDIRQNPHQSQMEQQKQKSTRRIQELIDKHLLEEQNEQMQVDEVTGELIETEVNYRV